MDYKWHLFHAHGPQTPNVLSLNDVDDCGTSRHAVVADLV